MLVYKDLASQLNIFYHASYTLRFPKVFKPIGEIILTTPTLDFYDDFGSPNVYFAWKALQDVQSRIDLDIVMHPVLIRGIFKLTENRPPWMAFADVSAKMRYVQLEIARFIQDYKLDAFKFNSAFPVNTVLAKRGAIAAQNGASIHAIIPL